MLSHAQMDQLFPGLGKKWVEYSPAASVLFVDFYAYIGEFEAILHRWSQSDWSALQPAAPMCDMGVMMRIPTIVSV